MGHIPKQELSIDGVSVLRRSAQALCACDQVNVLAVVVREDEMEFAGQQLHGLDKVVRILAGGATRAQSAAIGFAAVEPLCDVVLLHDAARCLVTPGQVGQVALAARRYRAASAVLPVTDTMKMTDEEGFIIRTLAREQLWRAATPQGFDTGLYRQALNAACAAALCVTDDNMLVESVGQRIYPVVTPGNFKITHREDFEYARWLLSEKRTEEENHANLPDRTGI